MTSFGYWADRVRNGYFLCCVCFDVYPLTKAATDDDGDRVDTCTDCFEAESVKNSPPADPDISHEETA